MLTLENQNLNQKFENKKKKNDDVVHPPRLSVSDHSLSNGHLNHTSVTSQITSQPVHNLLDVHLGLSIQRQRQFIAICDSGDTCDTSDAGCYRSSGGTALAEDGLAPRIGDEIDVVVAIEGGQVAGQGVGTAAEGDDVEFQVILPVGRFARELFDVAAQDGVDVTVGADQRHFDGRWRFGTAVATGSANNAMQKDVCLSGNSFPFHSFEIDSNFNFFPIFFFFQFLIFFFF